jgi:hypothetical protein
MYNPADLGYPQVLQNTTWSVSMSDLGTEQISRKALALFLIFGSLGAIVMSWISYSAMVGRAL